MKIKKIQLSKIIENYLFESKYPYTDDQKVSDDFRKWMINKRPNAAKKSDINITSETGDTKWSGLKVAYTKFGDDFEQDRSYLGLGSIFSDSQKDNVKPKQSVQASKKSNKNGLVILCHWKGSKPLTKGMSGLPKDTIEFLFPQGHGGIILINSAGAAHYFDFGRYGGACAKKDLDKLRGVFDKYVLQGKHTPEVIKKSVAAGGVVRHAYLGTANIKNYEPNLVWDPVKSFKKATGTGMVTVSEKEAIRLGAKAKAALGKLSDGDLYICPDVEHVDEAISYGKAQKKKCHLYTLIPIMNAYNCGTFATHLAYIAGKGQGLVSSFWQGRETLYNPTTQPSELIPNTAELMDYTGIVAVP